jgi:hypothetical protein
MASISLSFASIGSHTHRRLGLLLLVARPWKCAHLRTCRMGSHAGFGPQLTNYSLLSYDRVTLAGPPQAADTNATSVSKNFLRGKRLASRCA